jgi:ferritin-like metal-binding protein YciE
MRDALIEELREIYDAEKYAVKSYPRLIRAATSPRLKEALEDHLKKTQGQVKRIEQVFKEIGLSTRAKTCDAIRGFFSDAEDRIKSGAGEMLDVALLAQAQKIEHFEIAAYGSAHAFARGLKLERAAGLIAESLDEEKTADRLLNQIALRDVNKKALQAGAEEERERPAARRAGGGRGGRRGTRPQATAKKRGRRAAPPRREGAEASMAMAGAKPTPPPEASSRPGAPAESEAAAADVGRAERGEDQD